ADLDRVPDDGFVRPLRGTLATDAEYGQALGPGWFPGGYQAHVVGAFELRVPWRLGCPYPPFLFSGGSQGMAWYS
ncbi:MAG TPA: hypothetical protein VJ732_07555, partial [Bryobacteraceae bacterium]|nr:hypothetical protein [Bryobacteraceae bacterium]